MNKDGYVVGWAQATANRASPVRVSVFVNTSATTKVKVGEVTTSLQRNDLSVPGPAGFRFRLAPKHIYRVGNTVSAYAHGAQGLVKVGANVPVPFTAPAMGHIDGAIRPDGEIRGWALTPLPHEGPGGSDVRVEFYLDGGDRSSLLGIVRPDELRQDVNAATGYLGTHGFSFTVDSKHLYGGPHKVYAYAVDSSGSNAYAFELNNSPRDLPSYQPLKGWFDNANNGVVAGWAFDPAATADARLQIEVYRDGPAGIGQLVATTWTGLPRPDVALVHNVPNTGFSVLVPALGGATHHRVYVHAAHVVGSPARTLRPQLDGSPQEVGTHDIEILYRPNMGSRKFGAQFCNPELLQGVDYFGFFNGALHAAVIPSFWNNSNSPAGLPFPQSLRTYPCGTTTINVFSQLTAQGTVVDFEVPSIKGWGSLSSPGSSEQNHTVQSLNNARGLGIVVGSLSLDEPLLRAPAMNLSAAAAASVVRGQLSTYRVTHGVQRIGDLEPYPSFSVDEITAWLDLFPTPSTEAADRLDFFILDVSRAQAEAKWGSLWKSRVTADLQRLYKHCKDAGLRFGVHLWGEMTKSPVKESDLTNAATNVAAVFQPRNKKYFDNVLAWTQLVADAIGCPDIIAMQSWHMTPVTDSNATTEAEVVGRAFVPDNVPEPGFTDYSHPRLLHRCVGILTQPAAAHHSSSVPATAAANSTFSVTIQMRNTGSIPWTRKHKFRLGTVNPRDNVVFGPARAQLPANARIRRGELATFTFQLTAPAVKGNYSVQWQMVHEGVRWFGAETVVSPIVVN